MPASRESRSDLVELLLALFEPDELRRWIRGGPGGDEIKDLLPGSAATAEDLATAAVDHLDQRDLLDATFFERLEEARPRRHEQILKVRVAFERPQSSGDPRWTAPDRRPARRARVAVWVGGAVLVATTGTALVLLDPTHRLGQPPLVGTWDAAGWMQSQGYGPNAAPGAFPLPGMVLQVAREAGPGRVQEVWPPDCFLPPETCTGRVLSSRVAVDPATKDRALDPASLEALFSGSTLAGVTLLSATPEDLWKVDLPLGLLDGALPDACVAALARPITDGAPPTWYRFVVGTLESTSLRLVLGLPSDTDAGPIQDAVQARLSPQACGTARGDDIRVAIVERSRDRTVLRATGRFVLGYTCRTPSPVDDQGHEADHEPSYGNCRWKD